MLSKVKDYIKKNNLLDVNGLYLVAISGGADSVALLLILVRLGYKVEAIHCNFHLRGEESDRDERFCEELCQGLRVPFHRIHFDTRTYAATHKVSIELAARELRYNYFEQLCHDLDATGVCVAHHRDDSVETVLINMLRGTGLQGLTGIQPQRGRVLRPLLGVSRQEIEAYLCECGQAYITDSTNLEDDVTRNRVRHHLIPLLKELNPAAVENIQRMTENLAEVNLVVHAVFDKYKDVKSLDISELDRYGSREYLLFEWLKNYGFNGRQVHQLMNSLETGRCFSSCTHDVLVDRNRLIVEPHTEPLKPQKIPEAGIYVVGDSLRITVAEKPVEEGFEPSRKRHSITVDASKIEFPLTIRCVKEGDRMVPFGMTNSKLVSDMMTDCKMTLFQKRRQLLLVDNRGIVIWLVGMRVDNRCRTNSTTTHVLTIEMSQIG